MVNKNMSKKYHIKIDPAPARFPGVSKYSVLETEGCLGCLKCVKKTSCVYSAYDKRSFDAKAIVDKTDTLCVGCMQCVQDCKKNILSRGKNPRFEKMGNAYWTPSIISGHLEAGRERQDPRVRRRISRSVQRSGVRSDVDGHVGDRHGPPATASTAGNISVRSLNSAGDRHGSSSTPRAAW